MRWCDTNGRYGNSTNVKAHSLGWSKSLCRWLEWSGTEWSEERIWRTTEGPRAVAKKERSYLELILAYRVECEGGSDDTWISPHFREPGKLNKRRRRWGPYSYAGVSPSAAVNGICGRDWLASFLAHPSSRCPVGHVTLLRWKGNEVSIQMPFSSHEKADDLWNWLCDVSFCGLFASAVSERLH